MFKAVQEIKSRPEIEEILKRPRITEIGKLVLEGRYALVSKDWVAPEAQHEEQRLVRITGGFGCDPDGLGTKIYTAFLCDGETTYYRRHAFECIFEAEETTSNPDQGGNVVSIPISPEVREHMIEANKMGKEAAAQEIMRELRDGLQAVKELLESVGYYESTKFCAVSAALKKVEDLLSIIES